MQLRSPRHLVLVAAFAAGCASAVGPPAPPVPAPVGIDAALDLAKGNRGELGRALAHFEAKGAAEALAAAPFLVEKDGRKLERIFTIENGRQRLW